MRWDDVRYRPIERWPGEPTPDWRRRRSQFSAPWGRTITLLERELEFLGATNVVLQVALTERDIRVDGRPRAKARAEHPGVILAFDSEHGPLQYATDVFTTWQDNIRAIALSLEALRAVNRYGVSKHGEQYRGWRAITTGDDGTSGLYTRDDALAFLARYLDRDLSTGEIKSYVRDAVRMSHPDTVGGDAEVFRRVMRAKELLA